MECSMNIDCDLDHCAEVISKKIVKAKKPYKCMECSDPINKGDKYESFKGMEYVSYPENDEGEIFTHRTCLSCLSLREVFFGSYYFGMLWEDLRNEIHGINGEVPEACLRALIPEAREKVCDEIEKYWQDNFDEE